jgi:hypothetical protein
MSAKENPTTGDHTQGEEKPKTKKTKKKMKSPRGGRNRKRREGGTIPPSSLDRTKKTRDLGFLF